MIEKPHIVERQAQPYVAITALVTMETLGEVLPALHPEVFAWIRENGFTVEGGPFFKYNVIDMDHELEVEVGVPVDDAIAVNDRVHVGVLPGGRYAFERYVGHPDGLMEATKSLLDWAGRENLAWDISDTPEGVRWGARLEVYEREPPRDMNEWTTDLLFRLAE